MTEIRLSEGDVYGRIGEEGFARLVTAFYARVPADEVLGPMYPENDMAGAESRLRDFLVGRFGGPPRYEMARGHPRLRQRHHPFRLDQLARDRWVALMDAALDEAALPPDAELVLREFFHQTATFLINASGSGSGPQKHHRATEYDGVFGGLTPSNTRDMREVVVRSMEGKFAQDITVGSHRIRADEDEAAGGSDSGAGPHELLLAALGACTSITLRMYAERKGWVVRQVQVRLTGGAADGRYAIERHLTIDGDLDPEQRQRLVEIASRCPVHRTLTGEVVVHTTEGP